jgi:hypothetical protein
MLPNAVPPLLSLKVRRTADEIIAMDAGEDSALAKLAGPSKTKEVFNIDHALEITDVHSLLERQCFSFIVFINAIHDAQKVQNGIVRRFEERSDRLENHITQLSEALFNRMREMNDRIDSISRTLVPKPIFRKISPVSDFGRITGIAQTGPHIALTTATGHQVILNKSTLAIEEIAEPVPGESLFCPIFGFRQTKLYLFTVTSGRKLLFACPLKTQASQILEVDCFTISDESLHDAFDVAAGQGASVSFYQIETDTPMTLKQVGAAKGLRGSVSQIVTDNENTAVYILTSRKTFYSISATTYQVLASMQFQMSVMQLSLTRLFIVISIAPNDVVLLERNREKLKEISRFPVADGLRRIHSTDKSLFVITKNQVIERRDLCQPLVHCRICEPQAADYNPLEYIGAIGTSGGEVYVAHGNRISLWS